ncbi:tRNA synthetases class I (M)-domain-containing protein, partial [Armillaria luteobubalina]
MFRRLPLHPLRLLSPRALGCRHVSTAKPFYITTPIFYPNAVPHIGHLYSLLIADIYYRYHALKDPSRPAQFVTGTDEHGLKIQKAAQAKGLPPREFCDQLSTHFRRLSQTANISYTRFIRTSEDAHEEAVQHIWRELDAQGLVYKGTYSGWYSITDECFYPDGAVTHIPGSPSQTIATETSSPVEYTTETNYMFRLSAFREALLDHYTTHPNSIFPQQYLTDTIAILSSPLQDISISRPRSRLSWGIEVPGDPEHTIYVWIDAVISYLTAIGYPWKNADSGFSNGWPVDLQIIGKDIVRFHAIYLPAILLALKLPLQRQLLAHAHWTSSQKKMSKSLGNTTDPFDVMGAYGVDPIRYYMAIAGGNFRDDVDWSDAQVKKETTELRNILGNFLLRVTSSKIRGIIKGAREKGVLEPAKDRRYEPLSDALKVLPGQVAKDLESLEVSDAIKRIMEVVRLANKILTDVEPWNGDSPAVTLTSFNTSIEALRVAGICLQPFIPDTAKKLLDSLGIREEERTWAHADEVGVAGGLVKGVKLFEK